MSTLQASALPTDSFNFNDLLSLSVWVVWVAYGLYTLIVFVTTARNAGLVLALIRLLSARIIVPLLIPIGFTLFTMSLIFIPPQEVGVIVSLLSPGGIRPQPLRAGLHWVIPILEWSETYPVYWQTYTMSGTASENDINRSGSESDLSPVAKDSDVEDSGTFDSIRARTSDGQEVHLDTSIIFRIDEQQVVALHVEWQNRYIVDLVRPLIRGVVRSQVSQFTAREVNSDARRDLELTLDRQLRDQLGQKGLLVDQFLLRDITFSPEFVAAIEAKQVAVEQQAQAIYEAERMRALAQGEADAAIIQANGQSEALKLIGDALAQNNELVTYHYVEKLAPNIRVMLVPNDAPFLLPLPDLGTLEPLTTADPMATEPTDTEQTNPQNAVAGTPTPEPIAPTPEVWPTTSLSITLPLSITEILSPTSQ